MEDAGCMAECATTGAAGADACAAASMDSSIIVVFHGGGGAPCSIFSSGGEKVTQNRWRHSRQCDYKSF